MSTFLGQFVVIFDGFRMKQTKMYVCTFEEFILDDLHYLMYKMELRILCRNYTGIYTIATKDEKCENCS